MNHGGKEIYRFGDIQIDPAQHTVKRNGEEQHLRQRSFEVLLYLLENRGRLVSKEELIEQIWRVAAVTDDALVQSIVEIRKAVGDDPRHPHYIKTVPKSGYRFIATLEEIPSNQAAVVMEQVTSIEVEFEEEIAELPQAEKHPIEIESPQRQLDVIPTAHRSKSSLLAFTAVISLAVALLIFIVPKLFHSKGDIPEPELPQVAGKKSVVVVFFDNQSGDSDLNWLREGLADMVITGLSHSHQLNLLSRQQVYLLLERMGHKENEKIRLEEALEIGRKSKAEAIVLGSFAKLGDQLRVDVQLHEAKTGQLKTADSFVVEKPEEILTEVDLLALKLAAQLGVTTTAEDRGRRLNEVMTNQLDAYRYYSLGVEKAQALQNKDAIELLEKAIAIDPQFAMAHARIGYTYAVQWNFSDQAKPHLQKAFQLSERLTEKDKFYITAWYAIANLEFDTAIRSLQELIKKYPFEVEAYAQLGKLLESEGRSEEALETFRHGLVIDSEDKALCNKLGGLYSALYRHREAIAMHQRYVQLAPTEPNSYDSLGLSYQAAGAYEKAIEEFNRALELNPEFEVATVHLGNTYFQMGRYQEAIHEFQRYVDIAPSDGERARGYDCIAHVYWKKGDRKRAEEAALNNYHFSRGAGSFIAAILAFERGEKTKAEALQKQLLSNWPQSARGGRNELRFFRAVAAILALKDGQTQEALEMFRQALQARPVNWNLDNFEDCLANAYLELGRFDEAIAEYERILKLNPDYPLAHFHLGQAYEGKGRTERTASEYREFLRIWKSADSDLPEIKAARSWLSHYGKKTV